MNKGKEIICRHCERPFCWLGGPKRRFNGIPPEMCSESCVNKSSRLRNPGVMADRRNRWRKSKGFSSNWEYRRSLDNFEEVACKRAHLAGITPRGLLPEYQALTKKEQDQIIQIYMEMRRLNKEAGCIAYHVDHITPITKGGKHHPSNLQILTASENMKKGNSL